MDQIEQAVVQGCIRAVYVSVGYKDYAELAKTIEAASGMDIAQRDALVWIYGKSVNHRKAESISMVALKILFENKDSVIRYYRDLQPHVSQFIQKLFTKYFGTERSVSECGGAKSLDIIVQNWMAPPRRDHGSLRTGIYQSFRRHKPTRGQKLNTDPRHDWNDDENHAIICELIYLDLGAMECRLVTGDMNVYHGSLCITHEDILYGLLQRPADNGMDFHQRYIVSKIKRPKSEMYSGICIKIGNVSIRPVATEFFYVPVPETKHPELYEEFRRSVLTRKWSDISQIDEATAIGTYISVTPPRRSWSHPDWRRVRYVRDFEMFKTICHRTKNYKALFREPLRTLSAETLGEVLEKNSLEIFRQDRDFPPVQRAADGDLTEVAASPLKLEQPEG